MTAFSFYQICKVVEKQLDTVGTCAYIDGLSERLRKTNIKISYGMKFHGNKILRFGYFGKIKLTDFNFTELWLIK